MRLLVIDNLASGLGEGVVFDFMRAFIEDGDEIVLRSTDGETDLRTFLSDADRYDAVVASGGDGTLSMVAHLLADTGIPIVPLPSGTANLSTLNLLSPTEPHAVAQMVRTGHVMDFDLGEITLVDGTCFGFLMMAGAGYDASIMKDAENGKWILGQMAYFTSAVANSTPQVAQFNLVLDGQNIQCEGVGVLLINFAKIQFDLPVVHENRPRDGMLDVVVLRTKDAFGLIPAAIAALLDIHGEYPARPDAFSIYQAKEIFIEATPALNIQFDGEATEYTTPFHARILPKAARFVVSDECVKTYTKNTKAYSAKACS